MQMSTPSRAQSKSVYAGLIRASLARKQSQVEYAGIIRASVARAQA